MAGIMDFLRNNNTALLQTGLGLLGGRTGPEQAAMGAQGLAGALQANKTLQWLESVNPQLAAEVRAGRPIADAFQEVSAQRLAAQKPKNQYMPVGGHLYDTESGQWISPPQEAPKAPSPTDDMREYEFAKSQGFTGSFTDYQTQLRKAGATNVSTGVQLPAEMGARIGLGDQFLTELPNIKQKLKGGAVDSFIERGKLAAGVGEPAEIWRRIETGREALVRNLTGAGMAQAEAENVASRYQIAPTDSVETQIQKLEGLERDLEATKAGAIGARTGTLSTGPAQAPGSVIDYSDYFKQ